ncbi:MAG: prolipoprotein diacylglyceryl transferase, partial [Neisseriaceae bacterium]|nr:prolipoprotein diacylglyceryl transferase [Neisseriaceae bacterium]
MIIHPNFDPVAIHLFGSLAIRWYALSYIVGFMLFIWLGRRRIRQQNSVFTQQSLDDFLTWGILGVILGGRLGYVLKVDIFGGNEQEVDLNRIQRVAVFRAKSGE